MNKIYIILFLSFICVNICGASTDSRKAFIKKYKSIAIEEMDRTGIPASIKLALPKPSGIYQQDSFRESKRRRHI